MVQLTDRSFARRLDVTSLQLFVAVCELGSIGRAAERENIAPSAASKRLSDLEAVLEAPLLYRHTRGVDLTPAGESLLHHARAILAGFQRMQSDLSEFAEGVRGHVRMYANISAIVQFLPEDLGRFVRAHPQVRIDLEEHLSVDVLRAVREGLTDLGICNAEVVGPVHGLKTRPYRDDHLVLVVPADHSLAGRGPLSFKDALAFDYVGLHTNSSIYLAMLRAAAASGETVRLRIQVTGLDAMCRMILNGLGIGVMPQRAFDLMHMNRSLVALPLTDAWATRRISLVARDFDALPLPTRKLSEHLGGAPCAAPGNAPDAEPPPGEELPPDGA